MKKILNNKYIISSLVAVILFHFSYGLKALDPTNISWLMSVYHDWGTHYLGWAFYRNDPWGIPLTATQSYYYPIGTNVGFTDTIPIMAFFFKIFSGILPEDFQFFGIWLLSCYFLVSFYTMKIFNLYKINPWLTLLAVVLITANPVLIFRGMHPSLCAHWLLLASIYNYLIKSNSENVLSINKNQLFLFLLSATINPYLAAMLAGFNVIIPLKHYWYEKTLSIKKVIIFPALAFGSALIVWILFGLIEFDNGTNLDVGNIYGMYAVNLNSFFNSYGFYSRFLPDLGMVTDRQHEGFAYLGIGMIIIIGIALLYCVYLFFINRDVFKLQKSLLLLLILTIVLFIFGASNHVSWGKEVLFTYRTLGIVEKLGNIYRATGRFVWVAYYLILLFSLVVFSKIKINFYIKIFCLTLLVGLQLYDIDNLITARHLKSGKFHTKLQDEKWLTIFSTFDEIITYPPYTNNLVYNQDYQDLSFLALKAHKPITNGYAARENVDKIRIYRDTINSRLKNGIIFKNQVFITNREGLKDFSSLFYKDKVNLKKQDNFYFIFSKDVPIKSSLFAEEKDVKLIDSIKNTIPRSDNFQQIKNNWATKENLQFFVESFSFKENVMNSSGWAFNKSTKNGVKDSTFIALSTNEKSYLFPVNKITRTDLVDVYKRKDVIEGGFSLTVYTDKLQKGSYSVGVVIKDPNGKYHISNTGKMLNIGQKTYSTPVVIHKLPSIKPIITNLEVIESKGKKVTMRGWAAVENEDSSKNTIKIALWSAAKIYTFETNINLRNDVTRSYKNTFNYDYSGFDFEFLVKDLPKGKYKIGVIIENKTNKEAYFKEYSKTITL